MRWLAGFTRGLLVVLAVSLAVAGPVGAAGTVGPSAAAGEVVAFQADQPETPDNATQHEDPRDVDASGDLAALRGWLAGRMAVQLEDCMVEVGLGETDVCEFEDQYPEWLGMYVDVADDTSGDDDDRLAGTLGNAANDSVAYSESVSEFRDTYEEYQDAQQAGDEQRARRFARELRRQGTAVNSTGETLINEFRAIENTEGVNLSEARTSINATRANVTEIVTDVETELFVGTQLSATISPREISFLAPGTVRGRLETENGSAVADRDVVLVIGERTYRPRTDAFGRFSVDYRPVMLPNATSNLSVRYIPRNESVYLGSNTTVPVTIDQVQPTVDVAVSPTTAQFDDSVLVTGTVSADAIPAPGVPVVVALDGRRLAHVTTNDEGQFSTRVTVRAEDGPDDVEVLAALPLEDRAIAAANGTTGLQVETTVTTLALDALADGPSTVVVQGELTTRAGVPIPNQPVTLRLDGTTVGTARTDSDGTYRTQVTVPSSLRSEGVDQTVTVAARFDRSGTNLEASTAQAEVTLPAVNVGDGEGTTLLDELLPGPTVYWLVALFGAMGLLVLGLLWRSGLPAGWFESGREPEPPMGATPDPGADDSGAALPSPLASAEERLSSDADGAVMLAYSIVRDSLTRTGRPERREADTHWEFLAACRQDGLDAETIESLTDLTEAYEQAAYAPVSVDRTNAESVLEAAEPLVGAVD